MKKTTEYILNDLEKVFTFFNTYEPFDEDAHNIDNVFRFAIRPDRHGMKQTDLYINLVSKSFEITEWLDWNEEEGRRNYKDYRLLFTDIEKQHFEESEHKTALYWGELVIYQWIGIKHLFLKQYETRQANYKAIPRANSEILKNFEA